MNHGTLKEITGADLARELGMSEAYISRQRRAGKSDDQIKEAVNVLKNKDQSSKSAFHLENEAKARKMAAQADLAELDLAQKRGELIKYADVNQFVSTMIIRARDILLRIAPELRDRLAAQSDPIKIHEMIEAEIVRALGELKEIPESLDK